MYNTFSIKSISVSQKIKKYNIEIGRAEIKILEINLKIYALHDHCFASVYVERNTMMTI